MSKTPKHKRVSMTETAELQPGKVITIKREVKYDDEQIHSSESKIKPNFLLYHRCKKHFSLQRSGDWNSVAYVWSDERWVDAESNGYWILDEA